MGPDDLLGFRPDAARARYLDQRARSELVNSLREIFDACRGCLEWDEAAAESLLAFLRAEPVSPGLFAIYADLVEAIFDERMEDAQALITALLRPSFRAPAGRRVLTLSDEQLGPGQAARYRRLLNDEPTVAIAVAPVGERARQDAAVFLDEAERLLAQGAPEIAGEIAELVRETIIVESRPSAEFPLIFDGASTFYLWGAIFLNIERLPTRVALAEALVHEVGHCHLLGITLGAPLVENPNSERYASPLRDDPRPMDGIVHAAYVLARMLYCLDRLIESSALTPDEMKAAKQARDRDRRLFDEGLRIVERHAHFTSTGKVVFDNARRFVETIPVPAAHAAVG